MRLREKSFASFARSNPSKDIPVVIVTGLNVLVNTVLSVSPVVPFLTENHVYVVVCILKGGLCGRHGMVPAATQCAPAFSRAPRSFPDYHFNP